MVACERRSAGEREMVVVRKEEKVAGAGRESREVEDALRSLNTRSSSRVPQPLLAPRLQPLARPGLTPRAQSPLRARRPRPAALGLSVSASASSSPAVAMDAVYSPNRMSWGNGLLSPLSPTTIESLEARSRDVQERTFCKWYLVSTSACNALHLNRSPLG